MASEFFGRRRECRFYTAGCGNKMAVSVTGPRAGNELVRPSGGQCVRALRCHQGTRTCVLGLGFNLFI